MDSISAYVFIGWIWRSVFIEYWEGFYNFYYKTADYKKSIQLNDSVCFSYLQGWEFAHSLLHSSLFGSKLLILKSNPEQFDHVALYKRVTVSGLLFKKDQRECFAHDLSELLAKNKQFAQNIHIFDFS